MDLTSKKTIKELLEKHETSPLKRLGQNFLIDKGILEKIITAGDIQPTDTILEIGPGLGLITQQLAQKAKKVIAVEKDSKMCRILEETLKDYSNIEIIQKDILKHEIQIKNYKVVANLPFYLTSHLIRRFLERDAPPREMILIVQKEIAQRICAKPPRMNFLSVSVQFYSKPKITSYISKSSFWPRPEVNAAIIKISEIKKNIPKINTELFFKIVSAGFSQPRKQLINNLSRKLKPSKEETKKWLLDNNIKPNQRAETLSINDWVKLTKACEQFTC